MFKEQIYNPQHKKNSFASETIINSNSYQSPKFAHSKPIEERQTYFFPKKQSNQSIINEEQISGIEKKKKRSRRLNSEGEFSRALLLNNIVDKIKEVKNVNVQKKTQQEKLIDKFDQLQYMIYEKMRENNEKGKEASNFLPKEYESHEFNNQISQMNKFKQKITPEKTAEENTQMSKKFTSSPSPQKPTPFYSPVKLSNTQICLEPTVKKQTQARRISVNESNRPRTQSSTKITFTYTSPSPQPYKTITKKIKSPEPIKTEERKNYYFNKKLTKKEGCPTCKRTCDCGQACGKCGRKCDCCRLMRKKKFD